MAVVTPQNRTMNNTVVIRDEWFTKDHLGNVRAVVNLSCEADAEPEEYLLEQNDYLPFGTRAVGSNYISSTTNRWRYAGKEKQSIGSFDSGLLDFGARHYDTWACQWTAVDPMAEKYYGISPFTYCAGSPISIVDPEGEEVWIVIDRISDKQATLLKYQKGNLWISANNGFVKYTGNNDFALRTLWTLNNLTAMKDDTIMNILSTLINSPRNHFIECLSQGQSKCLALGPYDKSKANVGEPIPTHTVINYDNDTERGLPKTNETTLIHELQHAYDYETGKMKGIIGTPIDARNPTERRAVWIENKVRKRQQIKIRKTYQEITIKPLPYGK